MVKSLKIVDSQTQAVAEIAPELGFNCFRWAVPNRAEGMQELLWSEPGFTEGGKRASRSGIPILFPFPGRIPGTSFVWSGKEYTLEPGDAFGNAIHGFVHTRAWTVLEHSSEQVVARFWASQDDPSLARHWPADFCITADYRLYGGEFITTYTMENRGEVPLPCGLGTHAYFRLPADSAQRDASRVFLDVGAQWELTEMLPTGRKGPVANGSQRRSGASFGQLELDNVYTELGSVGGQRVSKIEMGDGSGTLTLRFDEGFREIVAFTPPHREAICIEPYTCCPASVVMQPQGIDAGLKVLAPGESWRLSIAMGFEPA